MSTRALLPALLALALPAAARGGQITVPAGFNVESAPSAGALAGELPDGSRLLALGSFGNERLERLTPDNQLLPFATGFGSIAGVAVSPVSGDIVVGDSFSSTSLWLLHDGNGDGDCLDPGETVAHPVPLPVLGNGAAPLPFDVAFRPGTDELYVSGSTPFGVNPVLGVVTRTANGVATLYAEGLGFAGGLAHRGDVLYVADLDAATFVGRVLALSDGNGDDDALDPGEAVVFAGGLSGAGSLAAASDGHVYLSGTFDSAGDFSATVTRLLPDGDADGASDGVDETWLDGLTFSTGLHLFEGPGGFVPGVAGDGELHVRDFGFNGHRVVRSAPVATTAVLGAIANNSSFQIVVGGAPGSVAFLVLSLDPAGARLPGIGDLCTGFDSLFEVFGPLPVPGSGEVALPFLLHGLPALVGLPIAVQGAVLEQGELGLARGIVTVIGG